MPATSLSVRQWHSTDGVGSPGGHSSTMLGMRKGSLRAFILVGLVATNSGCGVADTSVLPTPQDHRASVCVMSAATPVLGTFEVAHADEVRTHLPRMVPTPELDNSTAPAFVVMFSGPVELPSSDFVGGARPTNALNGVICIVANGVPEYYAGVDTRGWSK